MVSRNCPVARVITVSASGSEITAAPAGAAKHPATSRNKSRRQIRRLALIISHTRYAPAGVGERRPHIRPRYSAFVGSKLPLNLPYRYRKRQLSLSTDRPQICVQRVNSNTRAAMPYKFPPRFLMPVPPEWGRNEPRNTHSLC